MLISAEMHGQKWYRVNFEVQGSNSFTYQISSQNEVRKLLYTSFNTSHIPQYWDFHQFISADISKNISSEEPVLSVPTRRINYDYFQLTVVLSEKVINKENTFCEHCH